MQIVIGVNHRQEETRVEESSHLAQAPPLTPVRSLVKNRLCLSRERAIPAPSNADKRIAFRAVVRRLWLETLDEGHHLPLLIVGQVSDLFLDGFFQIGRHM